MRLRTRYQVLSLLIGGVIGSFIAVVFLASVYSVGISNALLFGKSYLSDPSLHRLTPEERRAITLLAANGRITSPELMISSVSSFYSNIITLLLGIIALFGLFSFIGIGRTARQSAANHAEDIVSEKYETLLKSQDFRDSLRKASSQLISDTYSEIDERVRFLEDNSHQQDSSEGDRVIGDGATEPVSEAELIARKTG